MRINARLKTLESRVPKPPVRCPTCDHRLDRAPDPDIKLRVNFPGLLDLSKPPKPVDTSNDYCKTCGRQLVIRLTLPPVRRTTE